MQLACKLGTDMHFLSFISLSTLVLVYQTLTNQVYKQLEMGEYQSLWKLKDFYILFMENHEIVSESQCNSSYILPLNKYRIREVKL